MGHDEWVEAFYSSIGERVRRGRREAGMSQADLAGHLRLTRASIANLEAGRQRPAAHQVAILAHVLDIAVGDLLPVAPPAANPREIQMDELRERARSWIGTES